MLLRKINLLALPILISFFLSSTFSASAEISLNPSQKENIPDSVKISLDLKGMDIVEALKILSAKGNLNMVIGGNIQGRVTLFLKEVDILDALEIMLVSSSLAYEKKGNILYIMTQRDYEQTYGESFGGKRDIKTVVLRYAKAADIAKSLEMMKTRLGKIIVDDASNAIVLMDVASAVAQMQTVIKSLDTETASKVFELKYAKAADIKAKISEMLTKGMGTVQIDERTNKVAVTDIASKISEIERVVKEFDEKPRQVLIEAKIVNVELSDQYKLGIDWQELFRALGKDFDFRSNFQIVSQGTFGTGFSNGFEAAIGSFTEGKYAMLIQALKTVGDTNLLSSPRVTALNNQEAKILVGSSKPYATSTVVTPGTGSTTTASDIKFLDVGVKLFVTPTISGDGFVTMKIKPEVSSSTSNYSYGGSTTASATTVPIISTTQAETSIRVKDGSTIVIGGLIKDDRTESVSKIPIAGDLPIIGELFKKTDNLIIKQELVIFITPHILSGEEDILEMPKTAPIGESRFTVPETATFERRDPKPMDPNQFRVPKKSRAESSSKSSAQLEEVSLTKVSQPASVEEYYYMVKDRILSQIRFPQKDKKSLPNGAIKISFRLSTIGALVSGPNIVQSTNPALNGPSLDAVRKSVPFPPFPPAISQTEKEFVIDFVFE